MSTTKRERRTEWDRQYEQRNRAIEQVNSIFLWAIKDQITHGEILEKLKAQVYTPEYQKRLTIAQKEYVRGYVDSRFDELWRNHIACRFKPCGAFCATFEEVQEYHDEIVADRCNGFHYWKASNGTKPYTTHDQDMVKALVEDGGQTFRGEETCE